MTAIEQLADQLGPNQLPYATPLHHSITPAFP